MDNVSKEVRSRIMSRIRSGGNKSTEKRLRAYLVRNGLHGWRIRPEDILGKPDFVFSEEHLVVFVDGAFWHGAPGFERFPKSRTQYWKPKIERNRQRDQEVTSRLRRQGWSVLRFWDYDLKDDPASVVRKIRKKLQQRRQRTR